MAAKVAIFFQYPAQFILNTSNLFHPCAPSPDFYFPGLNFRRDCIRLWIAAFSPYFVFSIVCGQRVFYAS